MEPTADMYAGRPVVLVCRPLAPTEEPHNSGDLLDASTLAERFFADVQANFSGQIIILENQDPPGALGSQTRDIAFTKNAAQDRYGLVPPIAASTMSARKIVSATKARSTSTTSSRRAHLGTPDEQSVIGSSTGSFRHPPPDQAAASAMIPDMNSRGSVIGPPSPIPIAFDLQTVTAELLNRGTQLTSAELDTVLLQLPRCDGPLLIAFAHLHNLLAITDLTRVIGEVWAMAEHPDRQLGHGIWRALFTTAGYTSDGRPVTRPEQPRRLYRGSIAERRTDWSWTDNPDVAHAYARNRIGGRPRRRTWTALVEPARLLARNTTRGESECVVDTEGLRLTEAHQRNRC